LGGQKARRWYLLLPTLEDLVRLVISAVLVIAVLAVKATTQADTKPVEEQSCAEWTALNLSQARIDPSRITPQGVSAVSYVRGYAMGWRDALVVFKPDDAGRLTAGGVVNMPAITARIDTLCLAAPFEQLRYIAPKAVGEALAHAMKR
jgi:hypothetical protein